MKPRRIAVGVLATAVGIGLLSAANYTAGAVLFLLHKENPSAADARTIAQAWAASPDKSTRKKLIASMLLGGVLCLGVPGAMASAILSRRSSLFGDARFANQADVQAEGLLGTDGIILGKLNGRLLRLPGYEFVMLAAPTRTGKGVGFVIPNLLTFPDSAVVLDIKGENYTLTAEFRRRFLGNEVFYWNPFSEATHRWNPLSYVSADERLRAGELQALAAIIYPSNDKEPFWVDSARSLFVGIALLVLETPTIAHTLGEVLRQGSGKGDAIEVYLRRVLASRARGAAPLSRTCTDILNRFLSNSENTLKGVVASFFAPLSIWSNPIIDKATSADDFDLRELRKKKMSVYLCIPAGDIVNAGFLLNLFLSQLLGENLKEQPQDNPALAVKALLMLDEFTAMGRIPIIAKAVGYMASYNLRLAIVIQDKTQLESVYGREDAHNLVVNMGARIYFTPADPREAKEYSDMIGFETRKETTRQRNSSSSQSGAQSSVGENEGIHSRALMLPQELRAMSRARELVVRAGIPVVLADKLFYYEDPVFSERFSAVPTTRVMVNGQMRDIPKVPDPPPTHWRQFQHAVGMSDFYLSEPNADKTAPAGSTLDELMAVVNSDDADPDLVDAAAAELARRKVNELQDIGERRAPGT